MNHNVISVSRMVDDVDVTVGLSLVSILDAIVRIMPKRLHFIRVGNLSNQFIIFNEWMTKKSPKVPGYSLTMSKDRKSQNQTSKVGLHFRPKFQRKLIYENCLDYFLILDLLLNTEEVTGTYILCLKIDTLQIPKSLGIWYLAIFDLY